MARVLIVLALAFLIAVAACQTAAPASPSAPAAIPTVVARSTAAPTPTTLGLEEGKALATQFGCAACHSANGNPSVGPTWKGLFGKEETLSGGATVRVDEAYLRESIVDPNAKVVEGFLPGIMPRDFGQRLPDAQVQAIVEYIKTLK